MIHWLALFFFHINKHQYFVHSGGHKKYQENNLKLKLLICLFLLFWDMLKTHGIGIVRTHNKSPLVVLYTWPLAPQQKRQSLTVFIPLFFSFYLIGYPLSGTFSFVCLPSSPVPLTMGHWPLNLTLHLLFVFPSLICQSNIRLSCWALLSDWPQVHSRG